MKMYLISDNVDTYTGMRLAGVDGIVIHEREELRTALEDVLADKTVGIVLLTEKLGREFPDLIDTFRLERKMPLLVEIPDRHGQMHQLFPEEFAEHAGRGGNHRQQQRARSEEHDGRGERRNKRNEHIAHHAAGGARGAQMGRYADIHGIHLAASFSSLSLAFRNALASLCDSTSRR